MGSHLQSHVTHRPRGHVTNQKRYISTFTRPTDPKLCRVVAQDEEISSTKSHDTSTTWSHDKSKNFISLLLQGLWISNLVGWWLKMRGPTHKFAWHFDIVVTWQIKNVISPLSQGLCTPILARWWLRMRGPYPQSHVTLRYCGHVTNKKRYISTFTRPMDPKLSRMVT